MTKERALSAMSRGLGPHSSRRGLLQAGLAIGTLALAQRAALGQSGGTHAHMPELGVTKVPVVPAMDQPLVEPEVRRSVERRAQHQPALRLRLARHRRHASLPAQLRGRRGPDPAHEAGRDPEDPARQRLAAQPRPGARQPFAIRISSTTPTSTSTARTAARAASPTTSCARCRPASRTTSRSRCPRTIRAAPTGIIRITTARPTCRWRAAWSAPSSSKATSPTSPRSPGRASASCCCRRSCSTPTT